MGTSGRAWFPRCRQEQALGAFRAIEAVRRRGASRKAVQTGGVQALEELVRASVRDWDGRLELALFGTDEPAAVASLLERFCAQELAEPIGAVLYRPGVGLVAGLRLVDGATVVVKVHRWNVSMARLAAIHVVQRHVADAGLPAPRPLTDPKPLGRGIACIEEHRAAGTADGRRPSVRAEIAAGLHRFVEAGRGLRHLEVGAPSLYRPPGAPLWPEPHSVRFDFDRTAEGAEWIDAAAVDARSRLDLSFGEPVIGHFDWRVENLGFDGGLLTAIYDWDSVAAAPEAVVVGVSAAGFSADWGPGAEPDPLPSVEEMVAFVEDYEAARGARFGPAERAQLDAANLALIAYGARCQHSDVTLHPDLGSSAANRFLRLLGERGSHLFDR